MKQWRRVFRILTLTLPALSTGLVATGCGGGDGGVVGDCPTYSQVTIWSKCTTCHSSKVTGMDRMDATPDVNFDSYDAAKMQGALANTWVSTGLMPPEGHPQPSQAEKDSLKAWVDCGMPR